VSGRGITWIFVYYVWPIRKSVMTLGVRRKTFSGRVVRRQRMAVFEGHRLPSTRSRWDIR
jgi:hypothetical protein